MIESRLEQDIRRAMGRAILDGGLDLPIMTTDVVRFTGELNIKNYKKCFPGSITDFDLYIAAKEAGATENQLRELERRYLKRNGKI